MLLHGQFDDGFVRVVVVVKFVESESVDDDFCLNSFVSFEDELADIFSHYLLVCTVLKNRRSIKYYYFYWMTLTIVFC